MTADVEGVALDAKRTSTPCASVAVHFNASNKLVSDEDDDLVVRTKRPKILRYMAKANQYLTRKSGPKYRPFALSRPEEKKVQGRPRRGQVSQGPGPS